MKVNQSPRVAVKDPDLQRELRDHAIQINALSEGLFVANYNAQDAAPTTGMHAAGDFVRNTDFSIIIHGSHEYILFGWI